jgi:hypothetical protein
MRLDTFKSIKYVKKSCVECTVNDVTFYGKRNAMLHTECDVYLASGSVQHFFYKNSRCEFLVNAFTSDVCNQ